MDFVHNHVEDSVRQRQLLFILKHAGDICESEDAKKAVKRRRRIWKEYEDKFVCHVEGMKN